MQNRVRENEYYLHIENTKKHFITIASHLAGSQTEANGATLKLSISCLPNLVSNFTKITGLVQALSTSSFSAVQYSANFRILQIFQFCANFAGFTKSHF